MACEPQNRSRMLLRDPSPGDISLPLLHVLSGTSIARKKKSISTHRNFTRNGRRANHRGLLLLNILLFAQGNLGAGKRGSRDREGHSVRYIYKEFFCSLPALPRSLLMYSHTKKTISASSSAFFLPPASQRQLPPRRQKEKKNFCSFAREKNSKKKEVVKHTSEIKRARVRIVKKKKKEERVAKHERIEYHRR